MKKLIKALIVSCMLSMISSCTGVIPLPSDFQATKVIERTSTPTLLIPTITLSEPIPTNTTLSTQTPRIVQTPTLDIGIKQNCLPITADIPKGINYSGVITVYKEPTAKGFGSFSLLDLRTITEHPIKSASFISDIQVSPDRKMYAYQIVNASQVAIYSNDGRIKKVIASPKDWYLSRWFDNQKLLFTISEPDPSFDPKIRPMDLYPTKIALLNPFTGERQVLPPDFPDIDRTTWSASFDGSGTTLYNPSMTTVVYPGTIEGKGGGYILWDIQGKKKLAQLHSLNWVRTPKWSPDGSEFIVNGPGSEFFLVSRTGDIKQITHYNPNYNEDQNDYNFYSQFYSWSPDGKRVAFWLNTIETKRTSLAILNPITGDTIDLCISYGSMPNIIPFWPDPVWSPDGKYIIVGANFQPDQKTNDLMLVDLEKGVAIKIAENFSPNGWIIEP